MASPQLENGHVRIANEVLEHLVQAGLSGTEWSLVMVVIRQTWGWRRKVAPISQSTFARALGRDELAHCHRVTLQKLCQKRILVSIPGTRTESAKWKLNKDWEVWSTSAPTGPDQGIIDSAPTGPGTLHLQGHSPLHLQGQTLKTIKNNKEKPIKNRDAKMPRPQDQAVETFKAVFLQELGSPYMNGNGKGDYVQLASLRKQLAIESRASPPNWEQTCRNYCQTPQSKYSLVDLASAYRYPVFRRSKLDRFGKPPERGGSHQRQPIPNDEIKAAVERTRRKMEGKGQ